MISKENQKNFLLPKQIDVDGALHTFDESGIPILQIEGIGPVHHPAWIGTYALQYVGLELYDERRKVAQNIDHFRACVNWLAENLVMNEEGDWVWQYPFDSAYNDIESKAPWHSAFGQALGIEALVASHRKNQNKHHLSLAIKAAQVLFKPLKDGGVLFERHDDIWFEEIPSPIENPPHILNGHMRALIALKKLAEATRDKSLDRWFVRGIETLIRWLPLYDAGYWLRYDLNPKKTELIFRFTNPYGFPLVNLPIHKIVLCDPMTGQENSISVGEEGDADGSARIAGNDWDAPQYLDGQLVRRLREVQPATHQDELVEEFKTPHAYFYMTLPAAWSDNLRRDWLELEIIYKDEKLGNICLQTRSIAPGKVFRNLPDGDLPLTGTGQWRSWKVPLRPNQLGWWVGELYAQKHYQYLRSLARYDERLVPWVQVAKGYWKINGGFSDQNVELVKPDPVTMPVQTPMVPMYSMDSLGVVQQYLASKKSRFVNGTFDFESDPGTPIYHVFVISTQLLEGQAMWSGNEYLDAPNFKFDLTKIDKEPALIWLLNDRNFLRVQDAVVYRYIFDNAYNDIFTAAPWQSAFGQAYVLKALLHAYQNKIGMTGDNLIHLTSLMKQRFLPRVIVSLIIKILRKSCLLSFQQLQGQTLEGLRKHLFSAVEAYRLNVKDGGVTSFSREGLPFAEEVPNAAHVLNAHLVSCSVLLSVRQELGLAEKSELMLQQMLSSLEEFLHLYDTGYWSKYDQNPKKEFLIQLDWLRAEASPALSDIYLENPQTEHCTHIDAGATAAFEGRTCISGKEWQAPVKIDGQTARPFSNGYKINREPVSGGTRHNVYLWMALPDQNYKEWFDLPAHRLVFRYKDVAQGTFIVKTQSIHEGNVLQFVPITNGVWQCDGDGRWKEAEFIIRVQDLGWYVGPDYQSYHAQILRELAEKTGSWFFRQYAEKWQSYLQAKQLSKSVIVEPEGVQPQM